jgi:hypothetical protein
MVTMKMSTTCRYGTGYVWTNTLAIELKPIVCFLIPQLLDKKCSCDTIGIWPWVRIFEDMVARNEIMGNKEKREEER